MTDYETWQSWMKQTQKAKAEGKIKMVAAVPRAIAVEPERRERSLELGSLPLDIAKQNGPLDEGPLDESYEDLDVQLIEAEGLVNEFYEDASGDIAASDDFCLI